MADPAGDVMLLPPDAAVSAGVSTDETAGRRQILIAAGCNLHRGPPHPLRQRLSKPTGARVTNKVRALSYGNVGSDGSATMRTCSGRLAARMLECVAKETSEWFRRTILPVAEHGRVGRLPSFCALLRSMAARRPLTSLFARRRITLMRTESAWSLLLPARPAGGTGLMFRHPAVNVRSCFGDRAHPLRFHSIGFGTAALASKVAKWRMAEPASSWRHRR